MEEGIRCVAICRGILIACRLANDYADKDGARARCSIVRATFRVLRRSFANGTAYANDLFRRIARLFFRCAMYVFDFLLFDRRSAVFEDLSSSIIAVLSEEVILL